MSEVFISYSRADRATAQALAERLKDDGYSVWWDFELYAGDDFHDTILAALDTSKAVIVIWTDTAVRSPWVRDEAKRAADDNKLITTYVEGFSFRNLPLGMGGRHAVPLDDVEAILKALDRLISSSRKVRGGHPPLLPPTSASASHEHLTPSDVRKLLTAATASLVRYLKEQTGQATGLSTLADLCTKVPNINDNPNLIRAWRNELRSQAALNVVRDEFYETTETMDALDTIDMIARKAYPHIE